MPDKLTDNLANNSPISSNSLSDTEIKKALECCVASKHICHHDCPMVKNKECLESLRKSALDLINRQEQLIKRLTSGKCVYLSDDETTEYCVEGPCPKYKTEAQIKAEAYKEFAEEAKKRTGMDYLIDELLNELVGCDLKI